MPAGIEGQSFFCNGLARIDCIARDGFILDSPAYSVVEAQAVLVNQVPRSKILLAAAVFKPPRIADGQSDGNRAASEKGAA